LLLPSIKWDQSTSHTRELCSVCCYNKLVTPHHRCLLDAVLDLERDSWKGFTSRKRPEGSIRDPLSLTSRCKYRREEKVGVKVTGRCGCGCKRSCLFVCVRHSGIVYEEQTQCRRLLTDQRLDLNITSHLEQQHNIWHGSRYGVEDGHPDCTRLATKNSQ
jgi:hypothetical protein